MFISAPFTHRVRFDAEMGIAGTHDQVHFFNGGATLQFAAIPLNLLGPGRTGDENWLG